MDCRQGSDLPRPLAIPDLLATVREPNQQPIIAAPVEQSRWHLIRRGWRETLDDWHKFHQVF
jgi:hypothetical protein